jgi:pimeloyl-ACP methyl ester carboxylesterase
MDTEKLFRESYRNKAIVVFLVCVALMVGAVVLASQVQQDFGRVEVSNVAYQNFNGIPVRAKLLKPISVTAANPAPGIVYVHGYQNNRETSDAYCIELARRGFVVLNIDAIGRGNSGQLNDALTSNYDETFGAASSFEYLQVLPFVDSEATGLMGHSVGGEIVYQIALEDARVQALVISGTAYTADATAEMPKNMLMIFGKWDEYRRRMTGTKDFEAEWMSSEQTAAAILVENPQFARTYGDFADGTARRVYMPELTHIQESHSTAPISEALVWMRDALQPEESYWIDPSDQIWHIKEWSTFVAMVVCFLSLLPLGLLLLQSDYFAPLRGPATGNYVSKGKIYFKHALVNGLLMFLYIPLIMTIFGFHVFVVQIDKVFPMMIVDAIAFWFLVSNVIGFLLFRRWFKKMAGEGLTLIDMGLSDKADRFFVDKVKLGRAVLLAVILFLFAYFSEYILEAFFIVDFRFIFPFASDLTPYRMGMFFLYFPFFLLGFIQVGIFLHGQMRRPQKSTWFKTYVDWSWRNVIVMISPLLVMLLIQYIPLFTVGIVPFVGPASALVGFMLNLIHIIIVLVLMIPGSTWFYQLTGNIYTGALLNALLVTWMFVSSQVIAPIPV